MAICHFDYVCAHIPSDLIEMMGRGDSGRSMIVERAIMF
jgi:hypothetical protein